MTTPTQRVVKLLRDVGGEAPKDLVVTWLEPKLGRRAATLDVNLAIVAGFVVEDEFGVLRVVNPS